MLLKSITIRYFNIVKYLTAGLHPRRRIDGIAEQTVTWDFHADHASDNGTRMNPCKI